MQGLGITLMRVMVGIVFLVHGLQKLFVSGIGGTAGFFESLAIPLPTLAAVVVTLVEVVGGAALILGLATRWVAIPLAIDMLLATLLVHLPNGFSAIPNGGYEFTLLLLVANVSLVLAGAGALALDNLLSSRGVDMYSPLMRFGGQERPAAGFTSESRGPDETR
jgi:putative oxidoreductase